MKRIASGYTLIEVLVVISIVVFTAVIAYGTYLDITVQQPQAYAAWCKETGNPNRVTFEDWKALRREEDRKRQLYIYGGTLNR